MNCFLTEVSRVISNSEVALVSKSCACPAASSVTPITVADRNGVTEGLDGSRRAWRADVLNRAGYTYEEIGRKLGISRALSPSFRSLL